MKQQILIRIKKQFVACVHMRALSMILACGMLQSFPASAIDVLPGAYTPLPAGTDLGQFFYTYSERNKQFANGIQAPINARLDSEVAQIRYIHLMDIGGYRVQPNIVWLFR